MILFTRSTPLSIQRLINRAIVFLFFLFHINSFAQTVFIQGYDLEFKNNAEFNNTNPPKVELKNLGLYEALTIAVSKNANIMISAARLDAIKGISRQQKGLFDYTANAQIGLSRNSSPNNTLNTYTTVTDMYLPYTDASNVNSQLGLTKLFTNGISVNLSAQHNTFSSNILDAQGLMNQNSGLLTFQVVLPLLKNSGSAVSSNLRASEIEAQAAKDDLEFVVNQMVLNSTLAYWDYLGKSKLLEIAQKNEKSAEKTVQDYQKLISGDQLPKADVLLVQGSLKQKTISRIYYQQALLESRKVLGRSIGLEPDNVMQIEQVSDPFPNYKNGKLDEVLPDLDRVISSTLGSRADLKAAKKRVEKYEILRNAAKNNLSPQLDVLLSASQQGLVEGYSPYQGSAIGNNWTSAFQPYRPGYGAYLQFRMPLENNEAKGLLQQQQAFVNSSNINLNELEYSAKNNIQVVTYAMIRAYDQMTEAKVAEQKYELSLNNERTKKKLGLSTILDVLNVEDRYNNAQVTHVQTQIAYASAVAEFLFQTNNLVVRDEDLFSINVTNLLNPNMRYLY
ncbi:MAG: TolC family protein [Betaproteobacteria bacterium]